MFLLAGGLGGFGGVYDEMYPSLSKASAVIRGWTNLYYIMLFLMKNVGRS